MQGGQEFKGKEKTKTQESSLLLSVVPQPASAVYKPALAHTESGHDGLF